MLLEGKVALVTGAATGIGHAIALRMAREGANIVVNYFSPSQHPETEVKEIEALGEQALAVQADVSKRDQVEAMIAQATAKFGRLDILVNNAGIEKPTPILDLPENDWDLMIDVDLKGAFLCTQYAGRWMRDHGGGSIVNISSIHEDSPMVGNAAYCAAKGGLRMLMRTVAVELAPYKIRVNNIGPGAIATPINASTLADPAKTRQLTDSIPLRRIGAPEDVANLAAWLASDEAAYVTGSTYFIDGGLMQAAGSL
jgi:glucose 1-dehydrogenase